MSCSDWAEVTLRDIAIEKGSYGIAASAVPYSEELYTYLRITDITDEGTLKIDGLMSVDDENANKYLLKPNDIVFARTGNSTGRSYFYDGTPSELVYAGFLIKFSLNKEVVNPKFMKYYTLTNSYKNWVASFSTGSTRGNINAKTYGEMKINLPPRKQQDFLVGVLEALDNKIELNNEMNKTLEEMAQALFKRWFVDFEFPNDEGEPYKSSGGEMVESELGMIPKGWEVKTIKELGKVVTGKTPPTKNIENYGDDYKFITPVDMSNESYIVNSQRKLSMVGYEKVKTLLVPKNSIGVTCIGSNLGEVYITEGESFTNQQINTLILGEEKYFPYVYVVLKNMKGDFLNIAGGSAVPIINKSTFSDINILMASEDILNGYCGKMVSLFEKIKENLIQNKSLVELRDSLLPKLMSGEIRVEELGEYEFEKK